MNHILFALAITALYWTGYATPITFSMTLVAYAWSLYKKSDIDTPFKRVPVVEGGLPIVGHGIAFGKDIIQFCRDNAAKYGKIFKVKIFLKTIIICTDPSLKDEFFHAKESEMSLLNVLNDLYFGDAFSNERGRLIDIFNVIKKSIRINTEIFAEKILFEATKMVNDLKSSSDTGSKVDLRETMIKFIARTSARCFTGIDLDDELYDSLATYSHLVNRIIVLTYFVPKNILHFVFNPILEIYRRRMIAKCMPQIRKYRENPELDDSRILRIAVDYTDSEGRFLTDKEVGEVIVCLLYVSSENTALGLSHVMIELANHPAEWERVRSETAPFLLTGDVKGLLSSQYLDSCIMESARLNTHIFPIIRTGVSKKDFGGYYIGDADSVAYCVPLMHIHNTNQFKDPLKFNPSRFSGDAAESKAPKDVMTWGAGVHQCPGKPFATFEIKVAVALLVNSFERFNLENCTKNDYFSPAAFAERNCQFILKQLPQANQVTMRSVKKFIHVTLNKRSIQVEKFEQGNSAYWICRSVVGIDTQKSIYNAVSTSTKNDIECLEIANTAWTLLSNEEKTGFSYIKPEFSNISVVLYPEESVDIPETEWNIQISIGASSCYKLDENYIYLNSGDVLICQNPRHVFQNVLDNTLPHWWNEEYFGQYISVNIKD